MQLYSIIEREKGTRTVGMGGGACTQYMAVTKRGSYLRDGSGARKRVYKCCQECKVHDSKMVGKYYAE